MPLTTVFLGSPDPARMLLPATALIAPNRLLATHRQPTLPAIPQLVLETPLRFLIGLLVDRLQKIASNSRTNPAT